MPQLLRLMAEFHLLVRAVKRCRKKEVDISTNGVYNENVDNATNFPGGTYAGQIRQVFFGNFRN